MKILHILDHSLPLQSGYTFRSQNIFKAQRNMGYDPVILTSPKHEESWKGHWEPEEIIEGFKYYRTGKVSTNGVLPVLPELWLVKALGRKLNDLIDREKPDILHAHSPFLNAMAAMQPAKQKGIPLVYEIRAFWEDAAVDHGTYKEGSWKYNLTKFMETQICKRADHVAVLCNGLKQDLMKRGIPENKLTPVFNGINPDDFKPSPPDEVLKQQHNLEGKIVIGFIGSFYRYEGLDLLVKAFTQLAQKYPNLILLLVGGGEMEMELKEQSLPMKDRVIFTGRLPHERIPGVYELVDILVYPRYPMRLTELVTPLKPLEAMAMGKALVASDVGGHKELIQHGETGMLFKAGDVMDLVNVIDKLLIENNLHQHICQKAPAWVAQHHPWAKTTAVYKEIYNGLRQRRKGRKRF